MSWSQGHDRRSPHPNLCSTRDLVGMTELKAGQGKLPQKQWRPKRRLGLRDPVPVLNLSRSPHSLMEPYNLCRTQMRATPQLFATADLKETSQSRSECCPASSNSTYTFRSRGGKWFLTECLAQAILALHTHWHCFLTKRGAVMPCQEPRLHFTDKREVSACAEPVLWQQEKRLERATVLKYPQRC